MYEPGYYEELEYKIRVLEEQVDSLKKDQAVKYSLQAKYENLLQNISDVIYVHDLNGNFLEADLQFVGKLGYLETDIVGKNIKDFIPERFRHQFRDYLDRVIQSGSTEGQMNIMAIDGSERYIWYSNSLMNDSGRQVIRGIARDITDSIHAKKALRESEKRLIQIIESNSIPTYVIDKEHRVVFWNKACESMTGISSKEIIGSEDSWRAFYPGKRPTLADLVLDQATPDVFKKHFGLEYYPSNTIKGAYQCEKFFPDLGKNGKWLFITAAPLKDSLNSLNGAIETLQDTTSRKLAEKALVKEREGLEKKITERTLSLEETNTALKVLLKKRDDDKREMEERIMFNVRELILPYADKLKHSGLKDRQQVYLEILESNLNDIVSPFINSVSLELRKLTPTEIQITNLVKQGNSNKGIADLLGLSPRTIEFHRDNIREKLGLKNKKVNLRTWLLTHQ